MMFCGMKDETDKRYQIVVKNRYGVLHMEYEDDLNRAHSRLMSLWEKLPRDSGTAPDYYGAAIYNIQDNRKRILTLGADYLL